MLAGPGLWPGLDPRMALAKVEWPWLKWAKGRFWSKIDEKVKVLRMSLPIVESLSGLQESIFNLSRGFQLNSREKYKQMSIFIKLPQLLLLAHVGPMAVWGPLGCCYIDASREDGRIAGWWQTNGNQ